MNYLGKQRGRREKKGDSFTPGNEGRENQDPELLPGQLLLPQRKQTQFLAQGLFPAPAARKAGGEGALATAPGRGSKHPLQLLTLAWPSPMPVAMYELILSLHPLLTQRRARIDDALGTCFLPPSEGSVCNWPWW